MRGLIFLVLLLFSGNTLAQKGKLNFMAGYNRGTVVSLFDNKHYASQIRTNFNFHTEDSKVSPYINADFLFRRFHNTYNESNPHGGYSTPRIKNDFMQSQVLFGFDLGLRVNAKHGSYWHFGLGSTMFGKRLINGSSEITNSGTFPDSMGNPKFGFKTVQHEYRNKIESLSGEFFKPFIKIEYGFQSKFTPKLNLNYKIGLSTFNAYFLMGISRKKVLKPAP